MPPEVALRKFLKPSSSFSPASVTWVRLRSSCLHALEAGQLLESRARHLGAPRSSPCSRLTPASSFRPASVTCVGRSAQVDRKLFNPASSFNPASRSPSTFMQMQADHKHVEPGKLLEPGVRHIGIKPI